MKWAVVVRADQRPAILNQKRTDWPRLMRWVPRAWTSWLGNPPRKLAGSAPDASPIPAPGTWLLALPLYVALTTKGRWHARLGFRWDDVDRYYALSATVKHFKAQ